MLHSNIRLVSQELRSLKGHGRRELPCTRGYSEGERVCRRTREGGEEPKSCDLIVGVDFTKSNTWTGEKSFGGRCLHALDGPVNPYRVGLSMIARTVEVHDGHSIPCYGFGDDRTGRNHVFSFYPGNQPAMGLDALLQRYQEIAAAVDMSGPTTFAPLIRQSLRDVYNRGMKFHVLLILADGQVSEECLEETKKAIVDACEFPLSIVMVGVGDGPWDQMAEFDDGLPSRPWDNFHFFDFNENLNWSPLNLDGTREKNFQNEALAEIAPQYRHASKLTGEDKKEVVRRLLYDPSFSGVLDPIV